VRPREDANMVLVRRVVDDIAALHRKGIYASKIVLVGRVV
jgi:hypothetical protein